MPKRITARRPIAFIGPTFLGLALMAGPASAAPTSVTITGDLQSELGCAADFNPACATTAMTYSATSDVWRYAAPTLPAGSWSYFAALNGGLTEVYGPHGAASSIPAIGLALAAPAAVTFYYDDKSHWVTDNINAVIATAVGDFQSELGCATDFDPACLRSWLQDVDGDGTYQFRTTALPAGTYTALAKHGARLRTPRPKCRRLRPPRHDQGNAPRHDQGNAEATYRNRLIRNRNFPDGFRVRLSTPRRPTPETVATRRRAVRSAFGRTSAGRHG